MLYLCKKNDIINDRLNLREDIIMKKTIIMTLVLIAILLCSVSTVHATTTDKLIQYASKTFTIAGEQVKVSDADLVKIKRYLGEYPVTEDVADKIIAKAEEAIAFMNAEGVSNPAKLSKAKKQQLLSIAQEAAELAGATLTYDATNKTIEIYRNGKLYDSISIKAYKLVQTGNNNVAYIAITAVAIIAIATTVGYRKIKANA